MDRGVKRTALSAVGLVVFMVGMSFAAVPLYDLFCRVTGYGGTTAEGTGSDTVLEETITVRFDASRSRTMEWEFRAPETRTVELPIGQTGLVFYTAHNPTDRPIAGQASYNVTPYSAGGYFTKIDCFCFQEQVLMPGQTVQMPVTFYVDPEIINDAEAQFVQEVTLSYTFYEIDMPETEDTAALTPVTSAQEG
ncbi:cytochrome c oxidase assembly protein [Pontivivens insulae]|uniref:Cytochrome c oxidase assembly protein CtaG n=1 Tax=Pontivivens insulae TaxID=1639689 RepID=A0A2R8A7M0_9RHOB|nr:cytochrome c oxidase assembly protein [Pontivivens insulae]RED18131.1 cytochrome c oxidase assembly protein subunit 11 [Pontivivens insulae]SPF28028.1 Cytochrome c oxidase assembly protein CtaG [Pontivivens insulae]